MGFGHEKREKEKNVWTRDNGESDRRGDRSSRFILNKTRILVYLSVQFTYLRLSSSTQNHTFHIHVRLDIWRCRVMRINVRLLLFIMKRKHERYREDLHKSIGVMKD